MKSTSHTIRVSDAVFKDLQLRAECFSDAANTVLERLLFDQSPPENTIFGILVTYMQSRSGKKQAIAYARLKQRMLACGWLPKAGRKVRK